MSSDEGLQLNVKQICESTGKCTCSPRPDNITVQRGQVPEAKDFISCTHKSSTPFLLQQVLGSEDNQLPDLIPDAKKVTVYYWSKEPTNPLFLEVERASDETPQYYYKYAKGEPEANGDAKTWTSDPNSGTPLQQRLDDRNCGVNRAIVYDLTNNYTDSTGGSESSTKSTCLNSTRKITSVQSSITEPPGGNYTVKEYNVTGQGTRISRVEYGTKNTTNIEPPLEATSKIRVYEWLYKPNIPLLIEFKPQASGIQSTWFENKNKKSTDWQEVGGDTSTFYDADGTQPQQELTTKLDEVNCNVNHVVQINVLNKGENTDSTYCHGHEHDGHNGKKRILVKDDSDTYATGLFNYKVYSHTPNPQASWESIPYKFIVSKFKNKNGELTGIIQPPKPYIPDVTKVLVYFCGDDPLLIYYEQKTSGKETSTTHNWYRNSSGNTWTSVSVLSSTPPTQHTKILEQLDQIRSPCQVPSVTIDIKNGPNEESTYPANDTSGARREKISVTEDSVENAPNYKVFTHTVQGNTRSFFTVQSVTYGQNITTIAHPTPIEKVTAFNVYYWEPLGEYGNPLLIKIVKDGETLWYKNTGQHNNDNWQEINDPSHVSGENLKSKLILLNCHLNNVTVINIGRSLIPLHLFLHILLLTFIHNAPHSSHPL